MTVGESPSPPAEDDLADLLGSAHRAVAARVAEALREAGHGTVTPSARQVFRGLAAGRLTLTALAEGLGVTKQTASAVVDALVERGYVERLPSLADRRAKLLVLTDRARDAESVASRAGREAGRAMAAAAGPEGAEVLRRALAAATGGAIRPTADGADPR